MIILSRFGSLGDSISGRGITGDEKEGGPGGNRALIIPDLDLEGGEVDAAPFPGSDDRPGDRQLRPDRQRAKPFEGLLTVYHRPVGQLAEEVRSDCEQGGRHETGGCRLGPLPGVVTSDINEIGDRLGCYVKEVRAKGLVDETSNIGKGHDVRRSR